MIIDSQTNFVFIADTLSDKQPRFYEEFTTKLKQSKIRFGTLPNTNDIWAVDYMPIQVSENKFVRFTYNPDYLISTKKWSRTISNVDSICEALGIKTIKSDIILDGGNISKWHDTVLMTTKIFTENKHIPELELIEQLKNLLEVNNIYFVPVEQGDWLGHIDGMARFINSETVLINDFSREETNSYIDFHTALLNAGLNWKTFPFDPYDNESDDDATGLYLNYLELESFLVLPTFGIAADELAIERATEIFAGKELVTVRSNEPAKNNGILNCLTWNIKR
jgi:agmatine deiminase